MHSIELYIHKVLTKSFYIFTFALAFLLCCPLKAQDSVFYSGKILCNIDYHHGQLPLAKGIHNIQVMRANREHPELSDGFGWTYNHAPMLAYWNNTFFLEYLSDSVGEHIPPGQSLLITSRDGYYWSKPMVAFPPYPIPDGTKKEGQHQAAKNMKAVMHQRMGFFTSDHGRLLILGYYGICLHRKDNPNDGKGIGRVVREIYQDGALGPIYFIRYNEGWNENNTDFPFYTRSKEQEFIQACNELLNNPLMMQQWNEEQDRDDPIIPLSKDYKAFCYYHLPDNRVVGLWKYAFFSISSDEGKSWPEPRRAPGFVTKNAKIWGQKTADGKYVTVYNPSEFRWPLALSTSENGLEYRDLLLVNGEITTMRYGGNYKSYGPQYVRGIVEGNGNPPDDNVWVTYSMNKEDIWVSRIPIPVEDRETMDVDEVFNTLPDGKELDSWNLFSPLWAPVQIEKYNGTKYLVLRDKDPADYAKAERLLPESKKLTIEFALVAGQNNRGILHIEFQNKTGTPAVRLVLDEKGNILVKDGYRMSRIMTYEPGREYTVTVELNTRSRDYTLYVNGEKMGARMFFAPVQSLERILFRTGEVRRFPNADTPTDQDFDVPSMDLPVEEAVFYLKSLKTY